MHCDELLAAGTGERPYAIGLPEAGLKICPGWGGTNMLPARMGSSPSSAERAIRMTASGATFKSAEEASEAGLITRLVRAEDLLVEARKAARAIEKDTPRESPRFAGEHDVRDAVREGLEAFEAAQPDEVAAGGPESAVSRCVRAGLEEGWQAAIALERSELNRLRLSDAGREAIEAFFAKSSKR
jgi:3-hydroxyacyl-CoA dehydrogenase